MYKDAAKEILNWILLYYDRFILIMVAIALVYLFFSQKDSRAKIIYPIALIFVCVLNPVLYHYVLKEIIYWRVFWLLPESIIIGYGLAHLVKRVKPAVVKVAVLIIMVAVLITGGNDVYKVADFEQTKNQQKVATETKTVGDIMLSIDENPRCIVPEELAWELRIYSGDIELLYGRNADGYINLVDDWYLKVANEMYSEQPDYEYIFGTAFIKKCNFVVCEKTKSVSMEILEKYGYEMVDEAEGYVIYYHRDIQERKIGGWVITQYGPNAGLSTCYTIEDENNNLIIIDGGYGWYAEKVKSIIREHDNHVAAWIITSQRDEHSGAFCAVMEDLDGITVDKIYTIEITDEQYNSYLSAVQPYEDIETVKTCINICRELDNVVYVKENDEFEALGITFKVLNTWDDDTEAIGKWHILNGSMCFMATGNDEKFLFISDLTADSEKYLLERHSAELDADIVQMNNHGMWSFTGDTYDVISPHTAFFDCKESDIDPEASSTAWYSYLYMMEKQVGVYYLKTAPNWVILR